MMVAIRTIGLLFAGALAIGVLTLGVVLSYSAHQSKLAMTIDPSIGVEESAFVPIGNTHQWIQIRGADRGNPVLLWLNGGPGNSTIPQTAFVTEWEKHFTIVMWDQRGQGKSFERYGESVSETMTLDRMIDDTIEVADYLRHRLQVDKIVLLGHSWGSILGLSAAHRRPDLFSVYVGTGQFVSASACAKLAYPMAVELSRTSGNESATIELEAVGPPPYASAESYLRFLRVANALSLINRAREPIPIELLWPLTKTIFFQPPYVRDGLEFSQRMLMPEVFNADLEKLGHAYSIPIVFLQGEKDIVTPATVAESFLDKINAPHKSFIRINNAEHSALFFSRSEFLDALNAHVRPFSTQPSSLR